MHVALAACVIAAMRKAKNVTVPSRISSWLNRPRLSTRLMLALVLVAVGAAWPQPTRATEHTFTVNSLGDADDPSPGDGTCETSTPGECTLRAALSEANGLYQGYYGPADTDLQTINVPAGTYYAYTVLGVGGNVAVHGSGQGTTILYGQGGGVLTLGPDTTAAIDHLTITNGVAGTGGGIYNVGDLSLADVELSNNTATATAGGAIRNFGTLVLNRVIVTDSEAVRNGGGISNEDGASLTIIDSTISENQVTTSPYSGGGIYNSSSGSVIIQNTTLSGNSAPVGGGLFNNGSAMLTNVTLSGNSASTTLTAGGGAIFNNGYVPAQLWLWNVTIAGNTSTIPAALVNSGSIEVMAHTIVADNTGGDCINSGSISGANEHHNLGGDGTCASDGLMTDPSDQTSTDPKLLALADNGGPTMTMALDASSPAIDAGGTCMSGGSPLLTDQRGWPRTVDGDVNGTATCDIGAFEASPPYQVWLPLIKR